MSAALDAHAIETAGCTRCALAETRTQVVVGGGDPDAELMIVGEAPGHHEDRLGRPLGGQAGELLDRLLAGIGLTRDDVYVTTAVKCRPPRNRDPLPEEIEACEPHLYRQIELVDPSVVVSLGNFATRVLSGREQGITRLRGQEQTITVAGRQLVLYPVYHPAAALYTPSMLDVLERDVARIPELLAAAGVPAPTPVERVAVTEPETPPRREPERPAVPLQLGLF